MRPSGVLGDHRKSTSPINAAPSEEFPYSTNVLFWRSTALCLHKLIACLTTILAEG
jgi:hypothetical protein